MNYYDDWIIIQEHISESIAGLATLHQRIEETVDENQFLRAGIQEAQLLFETVRASHDWTEKRYAWLDKYGKKKTSG